MKSVRPLITITILLAVGIFLYVKINEGPARSDTSEATLTPADVPPLGGASAAPSTATAAQPASGNLAPQWPSAAANTAAGNTNAIAPKSTGVPSVPELPELPPVPELVGTGIAPPPATPTTSDPIATPIVPPATTQIAPLSEADKALIAMGLSPAGGATTSNPAGDVRSATPPPATTFPADGRYGSANPVGAGAQTPTPTTVNPTSTPAAASFAASWPAIQAALDRGDLARAHQMLSPWFSDPTLTPAEAASVEALLGQLAGTVIYSTEHRLEPPYVVKPGETLETIAKQLDVPWQLLAKINGIPQVDQVRPGQQLKVIRGPFGAMIDLRRNQMALMVDGRYAGKFAVSTAPTASIPPGEWVVADKPAIPAAPPSVYSSAGASASQSGPSHAIRLKGATSELAQLGLTVRIAAVDPTEAAASTPADGQRAVPYVVRVSPRDAEELSDILSVGSRVVIQR